MRKESFDRKNEKYGADRRFRTHPADRTKRRNVDGRYEEQKPKKRNADRGRVNESRRIKKLRKRKKARFLRKAVAAVFCVAAVIAAVLFLKERFLDENYRAGGLGQAVNGFLKEGKEMYKAKEAYQSIDKTDENADTLKDLLDKNPETWEFVKNYSKMKDASPADTIGEVAAGEIPLLLQWDERWGYSVYGDNMIAVNGCGPTAVAMVVSGLLCDPSVTPYKVAKFAEEQGYYAGESGTSWTLMSEGVQSFGIWGEQLGLSRSEVFSALESGCPIICSMRPGDFTTTGHFIVLTKVENGKIKVNDPNSRIRSGQLWDYERLEPQIQNLWAFSRM